MSKLPGLNYNVPQGVDDLAYLESIYTSEFTQRLQLEFGQYAGQTGHYGVADTKDPSQINITEVTRPLAVFANALNPVQVDIKAGAAITQSGFFVINPLDLNQVSLARTSIGDVNVVFIEYATQDGDANRVNRFNQNLPVRLERASDPVRVLLLSDFNNPTIVTPERRSNIVVLSYVTVVQGALATELTIDLSRTQHADNRPWFSPVDIEHRSQVGSGVITTKNPHGTGINDLSAGNLTLYQQLVKHGMIISKDTAVANVPGHKICFQQVPSGSVKVDGTGDVTGKSKFGGVGARYCQMSSYPNRFGTCFETNIPGHAIAFDWIPRTNIVVFPDDEVIPSNGVTFYYAETDALQPPVDPNVNQLTFLQPDATHELVISAGLAFSTFLNPNLNLEGTGPIPKDFYVYVDGSGNLILAPQILLGPSKLQNIGTSLTDIPNQMIDTARIKIGLALAANVVSMSITIRISGTDDVGNVLTEDLTFSGATWTGSTLPTVGENASQFLTSTKTYTTLTNFQIINRVNDGANSTIVIYADMQPLVSTSLNEMIRVAKIQWDGLAVARVEDWRPISKDLSVPTRYPLVEQAAEASLVTNMILADITTPSLPNRKSILLFADDFRDPRYLDFAPIVGTATGASGTIHLLDKNLIASGDEIQLRPGKILTAVASLADPTLGQFNYSAIPDSDILNSIITAMIDPIFNVDIVPTLGINNTLELVSSTLGSIGNGPLSLPVNANPGSFAVTGLSNGQDARGLAQLNKLDDGLISIGTDVPSSLLYDTTNYPNRYRSFAVGIPSGMSGQKFLLVLYGVRKSEGAVAGSVRVRGSLLSDPTDWLPEQVLPLPTISDLLHYPFTFSGPVYKIQVTVWAECTGCAVYLVQNNM